MEIPSYRYLQMVDLPVTNVSRRERVKYGSRAYGRRLAGCLVVRVCFRAVSGAIEVNTVDHDPGMLVAVGT